MKTIIYPKDVNGVEVKEGDKIKGFGFLHCNHKFKIDLSPLVTVRVKDGELYFGGLSAKSFDRFVIVKQSK